MSLGRGLGLVVVGAGEGKDEEGARVEEAKRAGEGFEGLRGGGARHS